MRTGVLCAFFIVTAIYLAAFAYNSLKLTGKYSPDSVVYINAAEVFLKTGSVSTSFCDLHDAMRRDILPPVAMTVYNPLYPVLIAAIALVMKPAAAALLVALLGYGLFLIAAFCLLRHLAKAGAALLGTAALLHFAPLTYVAGHAWSETIALACLAVCLLLLLKARDRGGRMVVLAAGIMGGLAFITRMAMLPVLPVGVVALIRRDNPRKSAVDIACFAGGFFLIAAPVLVRKLFDVAMLTTSGNPGQALREIGTAVLTSLIPESWLAPWLYALFILISAGLELRARRLGRLTVRNRRPWACGILPLWALAYLAFLAYSRSRMFIDPVGARLAIPATFALLLFLVVLCTTLARPPFWLCASFALVLAGTAALSEARSAQWVAGAKLPPVYAFTMQHRQWETLAWLKKNVEPNDIIIAEDGMDLPLFLGPMKILYFFNAGGDTISADELGRFLERRRSEFQHAYLVLKPREEEGSRPDPPGSSVNNLHADLQPLARLKDGVIFAL